MSVSKNQRSQIIIIILMIAVAVGLIGFGISLVKRTLPAMIPTPIPTLGVPSTLLSSLQPTIFTNTPTSNQKPPLFNHFSVNPSEILTGECVQVSWDIQGTVNLIRISRGQETISEGQMPRNTITDCPPGAENHVYQIQVISNVGDIKRKHIVTTISPTSTPSLPIMRCWELLFYLGDDGEYHTPILESRISISFFDVNNLNGFSGCNSYTAVYTHKDQDILIIAPPILSNRVCTLPENVMEQEAAYAPMLETVTKYLVVSDQLELYNADDQKILVFGASNADSCP